MTRKVRSRVINSNPFIERRRSRRGSSAGQTPLRRASDGRQSNRRGGHANGTTYSAFTGTARPHSQRSPLGRTLDLYA